MSGAWAQFAADAHIFDDEATDAHIIKDVATDAHTKYDDATIVKSLPFSITLHFPVLFNVFMTVFLCTCPCIS